MKNRNYGIDLLRFVFMFMISMWHVLGHGGIIGNSIYNPTNNVVYGFLVILTYCAVDGFALISGYVSSNRSQKYEKIVHIWFHVFFYSFILTLILKLIGFPEPLEEVSLFKTAFPIINNIYWYMTAFVALFFAMPVIHKYTADLDETQSKKALLFLFILYSCIGFLTDPFQMNAGYSAIWLMVLYTMGILARKVKLFESKSSLTLIQIWFLSILITWGSNLYFGFDKFISYLSPTILLNAMIMIVLFSRISIKGSLLEKIAPLSLGIYLFQLNPMIWASLKNTFSFIAYTNVASGICYVFLYSAILFLSGFLIDIVRYQVFEILHIEDICHDVVSFLRMGFNKLLILIK